MCPSEKHSVPFLSKERSSREKGLEKHKGCRLNSRETLTASLEEDTGTDRQGKHELSLATALHHCSATKRPRALGPRKHSGILLHVLGKEKAALSDGHRSGEISNIASSDKTSLGSVWLGWYHGGPSSPAVGHVSLRGWGWCKEAPETAERSTDANPNHTK